MGLKKFLSYKRKTTQISSEQTTPKLTVSPSLKYYSSIKELPLNIFWEICIQEDKEQAYKLLILQGEPTFSELEEVWYNITLEYADLVSPETKFKVTKAREMEYLKFKVNFIQTSLHLLKSALPYETTPDQEQLLQDVCDAVRKLVPQVKLDYKQRERLMPLFNTVEAYAKRWMVEISDKMANTSESVQEHVKANYTDFKNMLANVILYHKMPHMSEHQLTVLDFGIYYKKMIDQIEAQKLKDGGSRNN